MYTRNIYKACILYDSRPAERSTIAVVIGGSCYY